MIRHAAEFHKNPLIIDYRLFFLFHLGNGLLLAPLTRSSSIIHVPRFYLKKALLASNFDAQQHIELKIPRIFSVAIYALSQGEDNTLIA